MPIGWYIVPFRKDSAYPGPFLASQDLAIVDHEVAILASGGALAWVRILGQRAIVKVRASAGVLTTLNGAYKRLPKNAFNDSLADLSGPVKTALKDEALDQGYTLAEIQARFPGDLGDYTLAQVLRFYATRRRKPRYDEGSGTIIEDGEIVIIPPEAIDELEAKIQ